MLSAKILAIGVIAALNQLGIAESVVNGIFYAFLVAIVGIAIVAVGGGGIKTMSLRWEQAAASYDAEKPKIAEQVKNAPPVTDQAQQAAQGNGAPGHDQGGGPPHPPAAHPPHR
ncbi:MAG: hypothetical protein L0H84_18585, partial [Pseudonocardia sp.]|nr:hypothetical protein [Pseudonocardia sp.]